MASATPFTSRRASSITPGNPLAAPFASSFTTDLDELGPQLLSLEPADGATDVSIRPLLRARFDDTIERASIGPDAFELLDVDGGDAPVAAELSFENGDRDLVLRPAGALGFDRALRGVARRDPSRCRRQPDPRQ